MRDVVGAIEAEYWRYKLLGESTLAQLDDEAVCRVPAQESNSVAVVLWHVAGNLESRFTDFLTSDGEKPWRDRDAEFEDRLVSRADAVAKWDRGWAVVLDSLRGLADEDLARRVTVRGQSLTVAEALSRSLAHTAYHVGQIVFLGKMWRGTGWACLSIPRGASRAYNANPGNEKPSAHATALQERSAHSIQPPPTTTSPS
jgi:uncharacterized damage-inducible protein DinB